MTAFYDKWTDRRVIEYAIEHDVRALSVAAPYGVAIMRGAKDLEYRSKGTQVRGPVLIYQSLTIADSIDDYQLAEQERIEQYCGTILGLVTLFASKELEPNNHAWGLRDPRPLRIARTRPTGRQPQASFWRPFADPNALRYSCVGVTEADGNEYGCGRSHRSIDAAEKCCERLRRRVPAWHVPPFWGFK